MAQPSALSQVKPYSVTFSVSDLARTSAWYIDKLGFKEVQHKSYPEFKTELRFLELNGYRVELIKDGNAKPGIIRPTPPAQTAFLGPSQFCFYTTDVEAIKQELKQRDVPIAWEFSNDDLNAHFIFIRDPEGNFIQFLQRLK
jgi:catechol 2,3-dioxygenase-like lactoylglutathione lyase family enzyme